MRLEHSFIPFYTKVNLKDIEALNVITESINLLEENLEYSLT